MWNRIHQRVRLEHAAFYVMASGRQSEHCAYDGDPENGQELNKPVGDLCMAIAVTRRDSGDALAQQKAPPSQRNSYLFAKGGVT
jgi:hypothetical protein